MFVNGGITRFLKKHGQDEIFKRILLSMIFCILRPKAFERTSYHHANVSDISEQRTDDCSAHMNIVHTKHETLCKTDHYKTISA